MDFLDGHGVNTPKCTTLHCLGCWNCTLAITKSYISTRGKNISVEINHTQGSWACKKYRNKAGMKTQEDYPTTEKL